MSQNSRYLTGNREIVDGPGGGLAVPERDTAFGQIVRRQFHGDFIASEDTDAIAAQPAGQVSQNDPFVLELHAEQPAGKFFQYRAGYFDAVFFTHKPPQHLGGTAGAGSTGRTFTASAHRDVGRL